MTAPIEPEVDDEVRARAVARELAEAQCEPEEIVATLELELAGWARVVGREASDTATSGAPITRARQWAMDHADEVTRWRLAARVSLRREIWAIATAAKSAGELPSSRERLLTELMRQHCGWAKQAPLDKLMDAYFAAQRDRDRKAHAASSRKLKVAR